MSISSCRRLHFLRRVRDTVYLRIHIVVRTMTLYLDIILSFKKREKYQNHKM